MLRRPGCFCALSYVLGGIGSCRCGGLWKLGALARGCVMVPIICVDTGSDGPLLLVFISRYIYSSLMTACPMRSDTFLSAYPSLTSTVHSTQWLVMLRRPLDVPVYEDSIRPLISAHCNKQMDSRGDQESQSKNGFGLIHIRNAARTTFVRHVFRAAGRACNIEVLCLIPHTHRRPADVLVQPCPLPPGALPDKPTAYDITVCSPYAQTVMRQAAQNPAAAAEAGHRENISDLKRTIHDALRIYKDAPTPNLKWHFVPLPFGILGAPPHAQ